VRTNDSVSILGNIDQINNALNTLRYEPNSNYYGDDLISILVSDVAYGDLFSGMD
jgi:hypothetical protein